MTGRTVRDPCSCQLRVKQILLVSIVTFDTHKINLPMGCLRSLRKIVFLERLANHNSILEEIKSILKSGNACYHSVQKLLSSILLSQILKIKDWDAREICADGTYFPNNLRKLTVSFYIIKINLYLPSHMYFFIYVISVQIKVQTQCTL